MRAFHHRFRLVLWNVLVLTALAGLLTSTAFAQDAATPPPAAAPAFVIAPAGDAGAYFTVTIKAGQTKKLTVNLGNAGTDAVQGRTYAADAYSLINGGFGIHTETDPITGPAAWIDYPAATLDLAPGKMVSRDFTVAVPKGTPPGQYIAGLVLQTAAPIPVAGSSMLLQTIVKSIAVFITVPGKLKPSLAIGNASVSIATGARVLSIEIQNTGNELLKPAGTAAVVDSAGETVVTAPIAMGSVYAGMTTTIELPIAAAIPPGAYTIALDLKDDKTGATASVKALPVTLPDLNAATPTANPITIDAITLDPVRDAGTGHLRFVNVAVTVTNSGDPIASARLTLHVTLNGVAVEDFAMSSSLAVPRGDTNVTARYLPAADWVEGTYAFSVTLESVDASSGQGTVIANAAAPDTVAGP